MTGDGSGLRGIRGRLLGRADFISAGAPGSGRPAPRVLPEDAHVAARSPQLSGAECPQYSGMMLAAIPHVTVATDGVLCTRTADGGGRVLTNALRVWNMSGSLLGEHVCRSMPAPGAAAGGHGAKLGTAAGGGGGGPDVG